MTNDEIIKLAAEYLTKRDVPFAEPYEFGEKQGEKQEVIFMHPLALVPGVVIDPSDVRVWVNTVTKEVTKIRQL